MGCLTANSGAAKKEWVHAEGAESAEEGVGSNLGDLCVLCVNQKTACGAHLGFSGFSFAPAASIDTQLMSLDAPYQGRFVGREHRFAVRVYFEDTDFSGMVYHARYLHFMERARSDMLARSGIDQPTAWANGVGVYAVAEMTIKYHRSARFDDALLIVSTVEHLRAAACTIHQRVMLGDEMLCRAEVLAAFTKDGRPVRQPKAWTDAFTRLLPETEGLS